MAGKVIYYIWTFIERFCTNIISLCGNILLSYLLLPEDFGLVATIFVAWVIWMFLHLLRLEGAHADITVGTKWFWNFVSGTRLGRIITNIKLEDEDENMDAGKA